MVGAGAALASRSVLRRFLLARFRRDLARLNAGEPGPLLSSFHEDAVLRFNPGTHRWAGDHRGRAAIGAFLREFVAAGITGEIVDLWMGGPPWALTLVARFDDQARAPDGERIYANRTVLLVRTRWGRIVEQEDFYEDTGRIDAFEAALRAQGRLPVSGGAR